jgi:hypothetical protein
MADVKPPLLDRRVQALADSTPAFRQHRRHNYPLSHSGLTPKTWHQRFLTKPCVYLHLMCIQPKLDKLTVSEYIGHRGYVMHPKLGLLAALVLRLPPMVATPRPGWTAYA